MGEKKLYLYMNDMEYGRKLQRYLNVNRHPLLRVETVTERETFWSGRKYGESMDEYWLTDDSKGAMDDRGDPMSLMVLDEHADERSRKISCRMKAEDLFPVILSAMNLEAQVQGDKCAPMQGVYGVYSPWGEEGAVTASLLAQSLAGFGECLYVNLREFPFFYEREGNDEMHLGDVFFRIDSTDFSSVVIRAKKKFGLAERLPGVAHYRDLWDIEAGDMDRFLKRLLLDIGIKYVVVLFNDVREAISMADLMTEIFFVSRKSDVSDPCEKWRNYAKTEKKEAQIHAVNMPQGWESWIVDMENTAPGNWLDAKRKKEFIDGVWNECEIP